MFNVIIFFLIHKLLITDNPLSNTLENQKKKKQKTKYCNQPITWIVQK